MLLIHVSLIPDGLTRPLLAEPALSSHYRIIHYYRRGYKGSTLGEEPLTVARQSSDARALLAHLKVQRAHVAGHSYGGIIALQLALDAPELVHSLALLEPVLRMVPSGEVSFKQNMSPALDAYRLGDRRKAVEIFCDGVFGPNWQSTVEKAVPGGVEEAVKNADLFIREQPAIREWQFGPVQAAEIRQPVLSVLGERSAPFMREGRQLLHSWIPQTEDCDADSTHLLQMQDPKGVAHGLAEFLSRHPMA